MHQMDILEYYSRPDIQQAIATIAQDRELVGATREGAYLKRPDVVLYPRDVLEKAKKGDDVAIKVDQEAKEGDLVTKE